jgi:hypothetical protein
VKLKRDYGQILADNEKLLADNAELVNQLQKLYDDLQNRPLPRDVSEDLDHSNGVLLIKLLFFLFRSTALLLRPILLLMFCLKDIPFSMKVSFLKIYENFK